MALPTTVYLAIDPIDGFDIATEWGVIVGISSSSQGLIDAGFDSATYTGNRRATIDPTNAAWDTRIVPGWYFHRGSIAFTSNQPAPKLTQLKNALKSYISQVRSWNIGLIEEGLGQPHEKVNMGHDILWRSLGAAYLIANDGTSYTIDQRIAWAKRAAQGAADVTSVHDFFIHWHSTAPSGWITWVDPTDATNVHNLADAEAITGDIADSVILTADTWVDALTA